MSLWPVLPFHPEETLLSYSDRLAMLHTGRGMDRLLRDIGINTEHFTSGREAAVARFAEAVGLPLEALQQASIRVSQRVASFRGEDISKSFLSPRAARYCPACLEEEGHRTDRRFRLIWGFRHVARCERHSLWLVNSPCANETNLRLALGTSPLGAALSVSSETPDYLKWLRTRLHFGPRLGASWMDDQTTEQVLAASEMLGGILQHGHKVALRKLTPGETEEATDIGFSIYCEGPAAIEEALDTIRRNSSATAVQAGPLAYYGKLFEWLDRRSNALDPGPIRDILRNHIVKHSAIEPGTKVLGVEIAERRYHTLHSLSATVGVERPRLSRLLKKLGEIPEEATELESGNMLFEAARTVPLIEAFSTAIPLQDVPLYLGATRRQVDILYRVGIVKPLIPRTGRGSVRHIVFARSQLDVLLDRIAELPKLDDIDEAKFLPISFACQRGAGRFEDLFCKIIDLQIPGFRRSGKVGIGAIYVDVETQTLKKKSI
ncbi:TniQ family protein [Meridianimarinicoccus aquatilis]|nr:TniQ family protein [Fluviibacterium aquatile]